MYISLQRPSADPWLGAPVPPCGRRPILQPSARAEHAKLLTIAAARRLRSQERAGAGRQDDADYWKQVAPVALAKAASFRAQGLAVLPG